jgi:hypothetical protein
MKRFSLILICFALLSCGLWAQTPAVPTQSDIVGLGVNWNQYATPEFNISGFYAHKVTEDTYSFNLIDCTIIKNPAGVKGIKTESAFTPGIGQHLRDIGPVKLYALATVGVATGGKTGLAWSTGLATYMGLGGGWAIMGSYRALSVPDPASNQNVIQGAFGILVSWGK